MATQIITIKVSITEDRIEEHGEPGTWDWEGAADRYMAAHGDGCTRSVEVLTTSPVVYD